LIQCNRLGSRTLADEIIIKPTDPHDVQDDDAQVRFMNEQRAQIAQEKCCLFDFSLVVKPYGERNLCGQIRWLVFFFELWRGCEFGWTYRGPLFKSQHGHCESHAQTHSLMHEREVLCWIWLLKAKHIRQRVAVTRK